MSNLAPLFESLPDTGTETFGQHRPTVSRLRRLEGVSPDLERARTTVDSHSSELVDETRTTYRPQLRRKKLSIYRQEPYDASPKSPPSSNVMSWTLGVAKSALSSMPILGSLFGGDSASRRSPPSATWDFQPSPAAADNAAFMSPTPESPLPNRCSDRGDDPSLYRHKLFLDAAARDTKLTLSRFPAAAPESPLKRRMVETAVEAAPSMDAAVDAVEASVMRPGSPLSSILRRHRTSIERVPVPPPHHRPPRELNKNVISVIKTIEKDFSDQVSYSDFKALQQKRKGILGNEIRRLIKAQKLTLTSRYIDYEQAHRAQLEESADVSAFKPTDEVTLTSSSSSDESEDDANKKKKKGILKPAKVTRAASPQMSPRRTSFTEPLEILEKRRSSSMASDKPVERSSPKVSPLQRPSIVVEDPVEQRGTSLFQPKDSGEERASADQRGSTTSERRGSATSERRGSATSERRGSATSERRGSATSERRGSATPMPAVTPRPEDSEATSEEEKPAPEAPATEELPWWKRNVGKPEFAVTPDFTDSFAPNAGEEANEEKEATPSFGLTSAQQPPLFGSVVTPRPEEKPAATSIFGAAAGSLFGPPADAPKPAATESLFGAKPEAPTSLFGAPAPATETTSSLFGGNKPSESIFGAKPTEASATSIFGAPAKPAESSGTSLFGAPAKPAETSTTSLFGTPAKPAEPTSSSLFGSSAKPAETSATSLFGAKPSDTAATPTSLFGAPSKPSEPASSIFGTKPSETPTGGLFGAAKPTSETAPPTSSIFGAESTSLFGAKPAESIFGAKTDGATSLFGTPTQGAASSLFGNKTETSPAPSGGGLFGSQTTPTGGSIFGAKPTAENSSIFGKPSESPAATGGNLFGASPSGVFQPSSQPSGSLFGTPAAAPTFGSSQQSSQPVFGAGAFNTSPTNPPPFGTPNAAFGASPSAAFQTPPSVFGGSAQQSVFGGGGGAGAGTMFGGPPTSTTADNPSENPFTANMTTQKTRYRIKRRAQQS